MATPTYSELSVLEANFNKAMQKFDVQPTSTNRAAMAVRYRQFVRGLRDTPGSAARVKNYTKINMKGAYKYLQEGGAAHLPMDIDEFSSSFFESMAHLPGPSMSDYASSASPYASPSTEFATPYPMKAKGESSSSEWTPPTTHGAAPNPKTPIEERFASSTYSSSSSLPPHYEAASISPSAGAPPRQYGRADVSSSPYERAPSSYEIVEGAGLSDEPSSVPSLGEFGFSSISLGGPEPKLQKRNDSSMFEAAQAHMDKVARGYNITTGLGTAVGVGLLAAGLGAGIYYYNKSRKENKKRKQAPSALASAFNNEPYVDTHPGASKLEATTHSVPKPNGGGSGKDEAYGCWPPGTPGATTPRPGGPASAAAATAPAGMTGAQASLAQQYNSAVQAGIEGVSPEEVTQMVGGSHAPIVQQILNGEGVEPTPPANEGESCKGGGGEKQAENTDRTDPITPATGAKQTTDTANSVMGPEILKDMAAKTVKNGGPEALYGNARERANMGKGALDGYSFNGPYDYPIYPGGRPDDTLTAMGGWRTKNGNQSSLWYSRKTAKGAEAKRNKYYKWSTKGGGNWRKMTKDEMVNVFQKPSRAEGGNFYGVLAGTRFKEMMAHQLAHKEADLKAGKVGAAKSEAAKMGFLAPQQMGGARKRRRLGYDGSAHQ